MRGRRWCSLSCFPFRGRFSKFDLGNGWVARNLNVIRKTAHRESLPKIWVSSPLSIIESSS